MLKINNGKLAIVKIVMVLTIVLLNLVPLSATYYEPTIDARSAILINADDGTILTGKDIDKQYGIASITKLMSVYVALDIIKENKIDLNEKVTISERVSKLKAESPDASGVWYNAGQEVPLEQLLNLSLVYSDNSAIMAIAEDLSGSEEAHVKRMNEKAKKLGMENTVFYNVSGLTMADLGSVQVPGTKPTDYNKSTSRDLALMIENLLTDYPEVLKITEKETVNYNGQELNTWNMMLPNQLLPYKGVKGLKTGTSDEAKSCFAGFYTDPNGKNFISVVLGANTSSDRFYQTQIMYDWENKLEYDKFIDKKETRNFDLPRSTKGNYELHPKQDVELINELTPQLELEKIEYNKDYIDENGMKKDIPAGKTIVSVYYKVLDKNSAEQIRSIKGNDGYLVIDYVSDNDVKVQNQFMIFLSSIPEFFKSMYDSIL